MGGDCWQASDFAGGENLLSFFGQLALDGGTFGHDNGIKNEKLTSTIRQRSIPSSGIQSFWKNPLRDKRNTYKEEYTHLPGKKWSERTDLNPRHSRWQRDALPTELRSRPETLGDNLSQINKQASLKK